MRKVLFVVAAMVAFDTFFPFDNLIAAGSASAV